MNKNFVKSVLSKYGEIRLVIEPYIFKWFSQKNVEYREDIWENSKSLDIDSFSKFINSFDYKSDKWGGLFDMSFPTDKPGYFFSKLRWGRDCDDFARIWALYLKLFGWEEITEVIVLNYKKPFSTAHVITIAKKDGRYFLFNYERYGWYDSFEEAVNAMTGWKKYPEDTLLWVKYKEH